MKNSKLLKQMLAGPYLLWSAAFIIIPLIMVFYYGLTNNDGGFTLMNLARITEPENLKALGLALLLSLVSTIICLILAYPLAMILTGLGVNQSSFIVLIFILPMWMNSLLRIIAEPVGKERSYQQSPSFFPFTGTGNHQHSICHRTWYGL